MGARIAMTRLAKMNRCSFLWLGLGFTIGSCFRRAAGASDRGGGMIPQCGFVNWAINRGDEGIRQKHWAE